MIDIPDNSGGVFRLNFLTDAGALFSLPLSNQIFCLCSSLLSAFWHLPLSVPPLLSPGRIPAMASKGKARGELSVFPTAGADQLRRAGARLRVSFLTNTPRSVVTLKPPQDQTQREKLIFAEVLAVFCRFILQNCSSS